MLCDPSLTQEFPSVSSCCLCDRMYPSFLLRKFAMRILVMFVETRNVTVSYQETVSGVKTHCSLLQLYLVAKDNISKELRVFGMYKTKSWVS